MRAFYVLLAAVVLHSAVALAGYDIYFLSDGECAEYSEGDCMGCLGNEYYKSACNSSGDYPCTISGPYTDNDCTEYEGTLVSIPLAEGDCSSGALQNSCDAVYTKSTNWFSIILIVLLVIVIVVAVGAVVAVIAALAAVKLGAVKPPFDLPAVFLPAEKAEYEAVPDTTA